MVLEVEKEGKVLYQCEECGFSYEEKEWADKCEGWCKEYKSCSMEFTKHAVQSDDKSGKSSEV